MFFLKKRTTKNLKKRITKKVEKELQKNLKKRITKKLKGWGGRGKLGFPTGKTWFPYGENLVSRL